MKSIAIIGTGISGLSAAYFLQNDFKITLFEKNDYVGGHTNTLFVEEDGALLPVDTGFMVYNEVTYPNLVRLFDELEVETYPTSMSFSVQHFLAGIEYCGSSINKIFAQRRNLISPRFLKLLYEINRFNREAVELLEEERFLDYSLERYLKEKNFSYDFAQFYLLPMSSAVWSTPLNKMLNFPAKTLVRFFKNHGFLGVTTHYQWRTVKGGARTYREKIIEKFRDKIRLHTSVKSVERKDGKILVRDETESVEKFDEIIFACHADQALQILKRPTDLEQKLLSCFSYQKNFATLHTDSIVMPKNRAAWASWNYLISPAGASTVYHMNSLQKISEKQDYFVSINDPGIINPDKILSTIEYEHPVFNRETDHAQSELFRLNQQSCGTYFCGSYFRYGFHEDALASSVKLAEHLLEREVWR